GSDGGVGVGVHDADDPVGIDRPIVAFGGGGVDDGSDAAEVGNEGETSGGVVEGGGNGLGNGEIVSEFPGAVFLHVFLNAGGGIGHVGDGAHGIHVEPGDLGVLRGGGHDERTGSVLFAGQAHGHETIYARQLVGRLGVGAVERGVELMIHDADRAAIGHGGEAHGLRRGGGAVIERAIGVAAAPEIIRAVSHDAARVHLHVRRVRFVEIGVDGAVGIHGAAAAADVEDRGGAVALEQADAAVTGEGQELMIRRAGKDAFGGGVAVE